MNDFERDREGLTLQSFLITVIAIGFIFVAFAVVNSSFEYEIPVEDQSWIVSGSE